jgi:hypothetical protein
VLGLTRNDSFKYFFLRWRDPPGARFRLIRPKRLNAPLQKKNHFVRTNKIFIFLT